MRFAAAALLENLREVANLPAAPDPLAQTEPVISFDARLMMVMGQDYPHLEPGHRWRMSNNALAGRVDVLEPLLAQALVQINSLTDALRAGLDNYATRFDLLNAQRQLDLAAVQVERTRNDLQDAKDLLQDAAIQQAAALASQANVKAELAQAAAALEHLTNVAQTARLDAQEQVQRSLASGIEADRLLAVAAQARADLAEADAQAAKALALAAQQAASTNATNLATANARVDAAVANITTLQTSVVAAQATATAAQSAVTALAAKGQVMLGIATPASVGLLGVGGTLTVAIVFPKPFGDDKYAESFVRVAGGAGVLSMSVTAKTANGCSLVLTNAGAVSLAVAAGAVDAVFTHQ